jgi:hypothetical protein
MEHTTKLTLVPTDEANLTQMNELDTELSNILKNRDITEDDKIKLYSTILGKYKKYEDKTFLEGKPNIENIKIVHKRAKANSLKRPKKVKEKISYSEKVKVLKNVGKPVLIYSGKDNPIKKELKWTKY